MSGPFVPTSIVMAVISSELDMVSSGALLDIEASCILHTVGLQ
jgi:hypothetical protein